MAMQCNKGHTSLKRSTYLIPNHTINHCPDCSSYNVEGSPHWPTGTLDEPVAAALFMQLRGRRSRGAK